MNDEVKHIIAHARQLAESAVSNGAEASFDQIFAEQLVILTVDQCVGIAKSFSNCDTDVDKLPSLSVGYLKAAREIAHSIDNYFGD